MKFGLVCFFLHSTGKSRMNEMTGITGGDWMTGVTVISRVTGMTRDKWDIEGYWDD